MRAAILFFYEIQVHFWFDELLSLQMEIKDDNLLGKCSVFAKKWASVTPAELGGTVGDEGI